MRNEILRLNGFESRSFTKGVCLFRFGPIAMRFIDLIKRKSGVETIFCFH